MTITMTPAMTVTNMRKEFVGGAHLRIFILIIFTVILFADASRAEVALGYTAQPQAAAQSGA